MTHLELRERVCEANRQLPATGLVVLSFGNVSGVDRAAGVLAIKPSGVACAELVSDDNVIVSLDTGLPPPGGSGAAPGPDPAAAGCHTRSIRSRSRGRPRGRRG